tara:strand:- start:100019 stop:101113 length:1095 start_codon:yes stop_codon:yes gene_type:complete
MVRKEYLKAVKLYIHRIGEKLFLFTKMKREDTVLAGKPQFALELDSLFQSIDALQKIILTIKNGLSSGANHKVDLDMLNIQSYLFHIGRILIQIREQAYHFQYRMSQYEEEDCFSQEMPFQAAHQSIHKCLTTIGMLLNILQKKHISQLRDDKVFFSMVNTLDLNAAEFTSQMRRYNRFCAEKETLNELFNWDKLVLDTFISKSVKLNAMTISNEFDAGTTNRDKQCVLLTQASAIHEAVYGKLLKDIIDIFHELKKCYVVSRKSVINNTLDGVSDDIQTLITVLKYIHENDNKNEAVRLLHSIYSGLESIRFSTNTESRCSRNLFEKSKWARTKLRQACLECDVGQLFLKQISLKKTLYIRRQ